MDRAPYFIEISILNDLIRIRYLLREIDKQHTFYNPPTIKKFKITEDDLYRYRRAIEKIINIIQYIQETIEDEDVKTVSQ